MVLIFVTGSPDLTSGDARPTSFRLRSRLRSCRVSSRRLRGLSLPWKGFPSTLVCEGIMFIVAHGKLVLLLCERDDGNGTDSFAVDLVRHARPPIPLSAVCVCRPLVTNFRREKLFVIAESTTKITKLACTPRKLPAIRYTWSQKYTVGIH